MKKYIIFGLLLVLTFSCKKDKKELKIVASKIIVNPSSIDLKAGGDSATVHAYFLPKNIPLEDTQVRWVVEDEKIAMVDDNGIITSVGAGTTNVTAISDNNLKSTCIVNVFNEIIDVKELKLENESDKELSLIIGDVKTISLSVFPENATNKNIEWSSSNSDVARVENGVVTALAAGKTSVLAVANNGVKVRCHITVGDKDVEAKSISIIYNSEVVNESEGTILRLNKTKVLNAWILPDDTTNKDVVWSSSDKLIATVADNGEVTALKKGEVIITATTSNGIEAKCRVSIK